MATSITGRTAIAFARRTGHPLRLCVYPFLEFTPDEAEALPEIEIPMVGASLPDLEGEELWKIFHEVERTVPLPSNQELDASLRHWMKKAQQCV